MFRELMARRCNRAVMRMTLDIADDLLRQLKEISAACDQSLTQTADEILRLGLQQRAQPARRRRPYREPVGDLGPPRIDLTKATEIAAGMDDDKILRGMARSGE